MLNVADVTSGLTMEFSLLVAEVKKLARVFSETEFLGEISHLPSAHDGYLMVCFSKLDWLSQLAYDDDNQTVRMQVSIDEYMYPNKTEEQLVAIHLFRHKLMHTGNLRLLYNPKTNIAYTWRLHWENIPGGMPHFTITEETKNSQEYAISHVRRRFSKIPKEVRVINISIVRLAEDLRKGCQAYLADLSHDQGLQARCQKVMHKHEVGTIKS